MPVLSFCIRSKISLAVVAAFASAILSSTLPGTVAGFAAQSQQLQPLDPLTPKETELAAQLASGDRRVKQAIGGGRQRLVQVQFLALKPVRASTDVERLEIGRHAAVLFYQYDGDQGIHVVVDLEKRSVVSVKKIEGRAVPLSTEEISEAFALAARNERVRGLLGTRLSEFRVANLAEGERPDNRVEGLRVIATSSRDQCYRHRCVDLLFHTRDGYLAGNTVTVDLTAQTVRAERTVR